MDRLCDISDYYCDDLLSHFPVQFCPLLLFPVITCGDLTQSYRASTLSSMLDFCWVGSLICLSQARAQPELHNSRGGKIPPFCCSKFLDDEICLSQVHHTIFSAHVNHTQLSNYISEWSNHPVSSSVEQA